ncbi:putative RNase H type-1 domain-containing protein [Seiridium unicorne]|uniref:ribonuclease H n=1 Tax=Seiridium unicorne TaxID=138068 RepID=A0ABR2USV6_9PEZI
MGDSMKEVVETLDPVARQIIPHNIDIGTLVPLKTTLELRDNLSIGYAYVTRAPTKLTNDVVNVVRSLVGDDQAKNLPHLRRCSKPADLPPHLKNKFMNEGANGRTIHTGKSQFLYIMLGPQEEMDYEDLMTGLSALPGIGDDLFIGLIPVPLLAPTSQVQANLWSQQFWQTVYRKNNPLGPHPSNICRTTNVVSRDASVWMNLAHQIAKKSHKAGFGEPIGAVIIKRTMPSKPDPSKNDTNKPDGNTSDGGADTAQGDTSDTGDAKSDYGRKVDLSTEDDTPSRAGEQLGEEKERVEIVALAGDARWYKQERIGHTGNPMAHAALRAISMVAQKLVRAERREPAKSNPILEFEAFQDGPLLSDEQAVFEADHPSPDGYLCHDLELYMTHEPCTMCSMAILHSRMGRIVFRHRMPLTGGMSSEDRGYDLCGGENTCEDGPCGGGQGLGLHWRKELNWTNNEDNWTARSRRPILAKAIRPSPLQDKAPRFEEDLFAPRPVLRRVERFSTAIYRLHWSRELFNAINQLVRPVLDKMPPKGKKRKMEDDAPKFYAVRSGHEPGIYLTWPECQEQTTGFKGAQFKKFDNRQDANDFVLGRTPKNSAPDPKKPQKFYAVAIGREPGIYTEWDEAQKSILGSKGPKYQSFKTRAEAIEYIKAHGNEAGQKAIENEVAEPPAKRSKTIADGALHVYTDGSSRGNGKVGAAAGVGVWFGEDDPRNISERLEGDPQTNQRAELTAILRALQKVSVDQDIRIFTDSQYSISCVTEWYRNWEKKRWKTTGNADVKNKDLVQAIRTKIEDRDAAGTKTLFQWVKGHDATPGNVEADKLAVNGAMLASVD